MNSKMPNNIHSTTCLVGRFNAKEGFSYEQLDNDTNNWERVILSKDDYEMLKIKYYPAHITAMMQVDGENTSVLHYKLKLNDKICIKLITNYSCELKEVSLWFFPFDIILFTLKFDDSGTKLNDLTKMHSMWKEWSSNYSTFYTARLEQLLEPLSKNTASGKADSLTKEETKIRQYQVLQIDGKELDDDLLYEIGTFSPVGVVKYPDPRRSFKPSDKYFKKTIEENIVSVYSNWKALALNDSFTVLTIDDIYEDSELDEHGDGYRYFDLLYMRCLFEEYYCFDRNNLFRNQEFINVDEQLEEIKEMERNYFYDDLSYDFLPPLMLRAIDKGLGLQGDREELTQHIKQSYEEMQDKKEMQRRKIIEFVVSMVQVLAVFSISGTVYQLLIASWDCLDCPLTAIITFAIAFVTSVLIISVLIKNRRQKNDNEKRTSTNCL